MKEQTPHVVVLGPYAPSLINFHKPLITDMVRRGWRVTAATPDIDEAMIVKLRGIGAQAVSIPLSRTGMNPVGDLAYLWNLTRLFRRLRPDVLLAYTAKPVIWGALAARAAGVPRTVVMITGLGYAFIDKSSPSLRHRLLKAVVSFLYRAALSGVDCILFQNNDDRELFRELKLTTSATRILVTNGCGVDLEHFKRTSLPGKYTFLMISRLIHAKGVREYAAAALSLKTMYPHAVFRLVGWIDKGPDALDAQELHRWQDGGLEYLGKLDDVRPAITGADVFVLPSYREGGAQSSLEAMAMGRPIVTTNVPGCRETVEDGVNGFLVPPRDAGALASAMERFIVEPGIVAEMGEKSWQLARTKYDVRSVNNQIMGVLTGATE